MVDPEEVRRVAHLARLGLAPEDEPAMVSHLDSILAHFEVLQAVDTEGVEPLTHPLATHGQPARDEPVAFPDPRESLVELTEHAREGFFVVPRVLEDAPDDDAPAGEDAHTTTPDDADEDADPAAEFDTVADDDPAREPDVDPSS